MGCLLSILPSYSDLGKKKNLQSCICMNSRLLALYLLGKKNKNKTASHCGKRLGVSFYTSALCNIKGSINSCTEGWHISPKLALHLMKQVQRVARPLRPYCSEHLLYRPFTGIFVVDVRAKSDESPHTLHS